MTDPTSALNELDRAWTQAGFEVELVAPVGSSRLTLAKHLAAECGGTVHPVFHHDTEPSLVKGRPVFHHLSRGYEVVDRGGALQCRLVDDMTIQSDLDPSCGPEPDSYRVLSDEPRLLRLVEQLADPAADSGRVLEPVADVFGVQVDRLDGRKFRLDDNSGSTVAMVAPQGGQRERVCEVITPPLSANHHRRLEQLLAPARSLGFFVPVEAAVHVHLDAGPFRSAAALRKLVRVFSNDRDQLWKVVGTNAHCRRLGALPDELTAGVAEAGFDNKPWNEVAAWLRSLPLTKFSDCNLTSLGAIRPRLDTVEIRILPGSIAAEPILTGLAEIRRRFVAEP